MQRARHPAAPHQRRAPPPGPAPGPRHRPALAPRAVPRTSPQPQRHRRRDRHPGRGPRHRSPQGRHPRPARHQRPRPPTRRPRRARRVHHGRLERLHPPRAEQRIRRLLALPGRPSIQHADRHLGIRNASLTSQVRQIDSCRHRAPAHRPRRAAFTDRLRRAIRTRSGSRPQDAGPALTNGRCRAHSRARVRKRECTVPPEAAHHGDERAARRPVSCRADSG